MTLLRMKRKDGKVKPPSDKKPLTLYAAMQDGSPPRRRAQAVKPDDVANTPRINENKA